MKTHWSVVREPECPRCREEVIEVMGSRWVCRGCAFSAADMRPWHIPAPYRQFTREDYALVRRSLFLLSDLERDAVILKFWKGLDDLSIATDLGLDAGALPALLDRAFARIKRSCLEYPTFSRSPLVPTQLAA